MNTKNYKITDIIIIIIGSSLYSFGLVNFNMKHELAEGGITGITLLINALSGFDPAYSSLIISTIIILIGWRILGARTLLYTIIGTISLSASLWIFQRVDIDINLDHDIFLASLLAGLFGGIGSGMVYRVGGTTGGSDIFARIIELKLGISMGKSLLAIDIVVLLLSLIYIDLKHMMYTLIASFIFSHVIDFIQDGGYAAKGILVVSNQNQKIAQDIMDSLERGVTFLDGMGAYSAEEKYILYCVIPQNELHEIKQIIFEHDSSAFISIIPVHEALGEGFTYMKKPRFKLKK